MKCKLFLAILFLSINVRAGLNLGTNDYMYLPSGDSFYRSQYGERQEFFKMSYYGFMHPTNTSHFRDASRSGGSSWEMLTNRVQQYILPHLALAATNNWKIILEWHVSGNPTNGVNPTSNSIYGQFFDVVQAPYKSYNTSGSLVHDWPFPDASTNLVTRVIQGDPPYYGFNGNPLVAQYDLGGQQICAQYGYLYINTFSSLVSPITNYVSATGTGYQANSNLFFDPPNYDHPGNGFQLVWTATALTNLSEETNCYTLVGDWNSDTISSTNHCVVSGISRSSTTFSFTALFDRAGFGYYTVDSSQTNDCIGAYAGSNPLMPSLTNMFCEIVRITNCPDGSYNMTESGVLLCATTGAELRAGLNVLWRVHTGGLWNQKKEFLGLMCDMVNVDRTNVFGLYQPTGSDTLLLKYESDARSRWPANTGMAAYCQLMQDNELLLQAKDVAINAVVQQTNHTYLITQQPAFQPAPFK